MANNDQVLDLYQGRIDSRRGQIACRDRVHWLCSRVIGQRVLDIGCSQGISPIILGREGRHVLGVDIEEPAIERARQELAQEPAHVQERVQFLVADAFTVELPPAEFDAVIIGEVLEHLATPAKLVERAAEWLKPGGRLLVTVPLGYHPYHDHKRSFYLASLLDLLGVRLSVIEFEPLHDLYLCAAAERPPAGMQPQAPTSDQLLSWHRACEQALERFERNLWRRSQDARAKLSEQVPALQARVADVRHQLADAKRRARAAMQSEAELAKQLYALERENRLREEVTQRDYGLFGEQLRAALEAVQRAEETRERLWAELERARDAVRASALKASENDEAARIAQRQARLAGEEAQRWKANYKRWRDAERATRERLSARHDRLQRKVRYYEVELERRLQEVRYRIGDAFVRAARPSLDTLLLPFRLWSLLLEGFRRSHQRRLATPTVAPAETFRPDAGRGKPDKAPVTTPSRTELPNGSAAHVETTHEIVKQATRTVAIVTPASGGNGPVTGARSPGPTIRFPEFKPTKTPARSGLKAASILDTFSHACFSYELELVPVTRASWQSEIENSRPDFFLAESAWHGNNDEWKGLLAGFADHTDNPLRNLLRWCRAQQLPTVFWNKEDPPNYDHFVQVAREFDFVFTTDANCIPRYRQDLRHDRIFALPFAAQPVIHNPLGADKLRQCDLCFAGSWHLHKHPERRRCMEVVLEPALDMGLHIFDRCANMKNNQQRRFPENYQPSIRGSLEYDQMLSAYRAYRVFLNVNSVTDSPTMFSRRVFELLACGTAVVSSESAGIRAMFGGLVPIGRTPDETRLHLRHLLGDEDYRQRLAHLGYRRVMTQHTYRDRLRTLVQVIGLRAPELVAPKVCVLAVCRDPGQAEALAAMVAAQSYTAHELHLVLQGNAATDSDLRRRLGATPATHVHTTEAECAHGPALQRIIAEAGLPLVAWLDAEYRYGRDYLLDLLLPLQFTDAQVVGKLAHYRYRAGLDATVLCQPGAEHVLSDRLTPGSLLFRAELLRTMPLPDTPDHVAMQAWLRECAAQGVPTYAADRFNFIAASKEPDGHVMDDVATNGGDKLVGSGVCTNTAMLADDPGQPQMSDVPALREPPGCTAAKTLLPSGGNGPLRHTARGDDETGRGGMLFYCVNGGGLGHLTRSLALARRVRRLDRRIPIYFLSSSQALGVVSREGMIPYHMPPRCAFGSQISDTDWNDMLLEQLRLIVRTHRPAGLVYDGVAPYVGLAQAIVELGFSHTAMIMRLRHKHDRINRVVDRLRLFDSLILPGEAGVQVPEVVAELNHNVFDPIIFLDREELLSRDEARRRWNIAADQKAVYVQLGAGNINDISSWVERALSCLLAHRAVQVVLAESPIAGRNHPVPEGVHILGHYPNSLYFNGFDLAITAAGYNTYHELMHFGVPAILVPNEETMTDDQVGRAHAAQSHGAARAVCVIDELEDAIRQLLQDGEAEMMRERALQLVPRNGAEDAARYLLEALAKAPSGTRAAVHSAAH